MDASPSILYIEDNPENRLLVRRILQADGFAVREAENAVTAFKLIEQQVPDLILMDINMPDIDGYTLTTHIKTLPGLDTTPIIALTANVMKGDREKTIQAGCDGYIQKPVDVDTLSDQISRFLAQKR